MRYLRFSIFLSAILVATGVFLPYVQLGVGGIPLGKKSSVTLYGAVNSYTFIERLADRADASAAERIADGLLAQLGVKSTALSRHLRDARSTLRDMKQVREEAHLDTIGVVLRAVGIGFLVILLLVSWLVLQSLSRGRSTRRRSIGVAVMMGLVAILSVGLFIGVREGLAVANAEVGSSLLSLGSGAYLMFIGALIGFIAAAVGVKFDWRPASAVVPAAAPQVENRSSFSSE